MPHVPSHSFLHHPWSIRVVHITIQDSTNPGLGMWKAAKRDLTATAIAAMHESGARPRHFAPHMDTIEHGSLAPGLWILTRECFYCSHGVCASFTLKIDFFTLC